MNIYSNSFFHRSDYSFIVKILEEGFKAFYCKEEIFRGKRVPSTYIGVPMVSFCDIPLTHVATNNYGKCGLAMSRKWGHSHHLEPVLYYPNDVSTQSTKMVMKAADSFLHNSKNYDAYRILGYAKPIRKPTCQGKRCSDNYAEREWRKVYACPSPLKWLNEDEYEEYRGKQDTTKKPVGNILHFKAKDVDFILVDKANVKNLRNSIMKVIRHIGGSKDPITDDDKLELISKILVYEKLIYNL